MTGPHWVYRFYASDERLLYVGYTAALGARLTAHSKDKAWWDDVADVKTEVFATRVEALARERVQIMALNPQHNLTRYYGKTPHRTFRAADELWLPFKAKAEANGTTATAVLLKAAVEYLGDETEGRDDGH